jgi:hypothetical protein
MSRLDDLIGLMRSAHYAYLVNPARNVRLAYIQIDDLAELSIKTWLQENVAGWSPISHQHNGRDYFKGFRTIVNEVQIHNAVNATLPALLPRFLGRRDNRNHFFHDHNMAALTVTEEECLRAFCDLYQLLVELFPDYGDKLKANRIAYVQATYIRLKNGGLTQERLSEFCRKGLENISIIITPGTPTHGWRSIYDAPDGVLNSIRTCFEDELSACTTELQRIGEMRRPTRKHRTKQQRLLEYQNWLNEAIVTYFD